MAEYKIELEDITPDKLYARVCIASVQADMNGDITILHIAGRQVAAIVPVSKLDDGVE